MPNPEPAERTSKLVYVADDEPDLVGLIRDALEMRGFEVRTALDGDALIDLVGAEVPDLILLDINMPGPSGWEIKERLADDPLASAVPVIAVTAQGGPSVETSARDGMGFADFVRKPFRLAELWDAVDRSLQTGAA